MTIAFTICSINYLAQARTLGDSLSRTNPAVKYIIGLVDRLDGVEFAPEFQPDYTLLEAHTIEIDGFEEMCERYNITELNTAVKPFYFSYFFKNYAEATKIIYFDPDIIVYKCLTDLLETLEIKEAVVTPHICSPIGDNKTPNELNHLNTGVYNLGFCAFRRTDRTMKFLKWWEEKLRFECLIALCDGLFVDQNWMNFLPLFIEQTHIEMNLGYNAAYWNLHEREFSKSDDEFFVNQSCPLVFFHYSGYDPKQPHLISKYQDRFTFEERPDLNELFGYYHSKLFINGQEYYRKFQCVYIKPPKVYKYQRVRKALITPLSALLRFMDTH